MNCLFHAEEFGLYLVGQGETNSQQCICLGIIESRDMGMGFN